MDYLPAIVFVKDEKSRTKFMNKHMRDVLGADDSWIDHTMLEIFGDTDLARKMIEDDRKALSAGFELKEESVRGANGTERLYETQKFRIGRKDKPPLLGGIALDITTRKQAEEALHKERDFAESLINTAQTIILVLDTEGRIVRFNPYMEEISGYSLEEVKGKDWFSTFLPKQDATNIKKLFSKAVSKIQTSGNVNPIMTKDGRKLEIEWHDKTLKDAKGNTVGLLAIGQDITARMKAEEMLKASLREKEVLLQEIHHRVKNNMQIVVSLLRLQSYAAKDKKIEDMFKVAQNRIRSMALIHEKLYRSKDFASIDFAYYIRSLTIHLMQTYQIDPEQINFIADVKDIHLDINQGIPVGLLLNELISNALKHAFPNGKKGEIIVKFHTDKKGKKTLNVSDNGIGYPDKVDISKPKTLGMQLIKDLTKQIGGKLDLDNKAGTTFTITFT